jgi:hypothetical protein
VDLEKYVQIHAEQHAVLNGLTDYGYSGIANGTTVRKLIAGIKTDALDNVVTLYGDFIKQQKI